MTVFATALTTLHADPNMGEDAYFRRPPGAWEAVRAIRSQPSDIIGMVRAGSLQVDILASATTNDPVRGDEVKFTTAIYLGATLHPAGTVFVVEGSAPDDLALSWLLTLADHN